MPIIKRIGDNRLVKEITNAEHTTPSLTNLQTQTDQIPQKLTTEDAFEDYVVSGFSGDGTGSGLELTLTTGAAYVDGYRVSRVSSEFDMTHTYTASKDTYVDIDSDGELSYIETALGAGEPTLDAGKIRLIKVVTDGTDITGVTDLRDTTLTINRDIMFISEKEIVTISDTQTLTNKTLTTPKANVIDEETSDTGVTVDGCLIKDGIVSDSNKLEGKSLIESINWIRPELVGSGLSISGINIQALTSLNGTDVAFIDSSLDELRTYRFNGSTWSLVGSGLSIPGTGHPALTSLNGTDVAFIDNALEELRTYRFNGSTWSLVGSGLSISGIGPTTLTSLNGTDVAFISATFEELRTYRFNGSTWSLVGSGLSIPGISINGGDLTSLNGTDVAFIDSALEELRTYRFNGSTWSLVGSGLSIPGIGIPALTALNGTDVAFIDYTLEELRTYRFNFAFSKPHFFTL